MLIDRRQSEPTKSILIIAYALITGMHLVAFAPVEAQSTESTIVPLPERSNHYGAPGGMAAYLAAMAFVATLDSGQASKLILQLDSPLRPNWSNLPAEILRFERNGLRLGNLRNRQLEALFDFLSAALGPGGYDTLSQVMAAEAVLADIQRSSWMKWSEENYWIAFFGKPTESGEWGWQFGGHHLAVNGSIVEGRIVSMSPTFIGIEPSQFVFAEQVISPFSGELEDGLGVVNSLPPVLRNQAVIPDRPREIYTGSGKDGVIPAIQGSSVSEWPDKPRQKLLELIGHWVSLQPTENADARMSVLASELDEMYFAWNGPTDGTGSMYFRVQGPSLIIEFSARGNIGSNSGHIHSIYRDPTNEYGLKH